MSTQLKLRRGTTAQHSTFTGASGEVTVDTDKKAIVVHDGVTAGGNPMATASDVATSLSGKQATLVSGTNIKTINGNSVLGSGDLSVGSSALTIANKTAAYTVVASDLGKIINCTSGTFTVSLTAAATLGAGFNCWVWNTSNTATDVVTIDPNGGETIDFSATIALRRGEGAQIVCDGTNWQTGDKKTMRGYAENFVSNPTRPVASGSNAVAMGNSSIASGTGAFSFGGTASGTSAVTLGGTASADGAVAIGNYFEKSAATSSYSTAVGLNSAGKGAQTATGAGAMALGGSYASGTDSFAAAIANNTSGYGATGANSVAIGQIAIATGSYACAFGGFSPKATANYSTAIGGYQATASAIGSYALGYYVNASGQYSYASGYYANAAQYGKQAFASGRFAANGDAQSGKMVLRRQVTGPETSWQLLSDGSAGIGLVTLPNDSTFAFRGLVVARNTASDTDSKAWEFKGAIRRGATAANTALIGTPVIDVLASDGSPWALYITADTTNGALNIAGSGEAGKTVNFVATLWTSEVTG